MPLRGGFGSVRPLRASDSPSLFEALHSDSSGAEWTYMAFGPFGSEGEFAAFIDGLLGDGSLAMFALTDETETAAGMAGFSRIDLAAGSLEVGGVMMGATLQRTVAATETMFLLGRYVFDELCYRRYEWKCDALNARSRAAAQRLGFRFEGISRKATIYKGRSRDTAWYAMTDDDWRRLRPVVESWLDPSNFEAGVQRTRLSEAVRHQATP
ncbi:GNAT family N-acetyltransferase [Natronosporangium hydrolyticum]|uniref:GNAT family N-acetyltransferase n=1 Tax=Natronosporangium hydrolyticum TaxID=2811111 RepID=A0A895YHR9_9ACTN|nr:GNAT family protein [Natronosporangium hydrolyticum]QSB13278.1 GNAT family N-acetyltransferase [Natronosporangium hydrolyticum]